MTLGEKQRKFTRMLADLIIFAYDKGYAISLGEAERTPECAALNAKKGTGIKNSLHTMRLAVDLNLFKDGVYLSKTTDHQLLGEYWESIGGTWGGRFNDGNHYSLEHNGVK
ncbi:MULTISPECIES: M15 family metallopeptidase [Providencia]|uniref:M15 family metallopeptidase n=1 Tax=Providencia TaxID=586 RepID=UPI0012B64AA2|nr:M15 family metallopeptidase [Providencia sp. wls1914]MTC70022.1 M15 family peptidase [Providencia sp. wls1914]